MKKIAFIGSLVLLFGTNLSGQKQTSQRYDGIESVKINIASGDLTVTPSDSKQVEVSVTYDDTRMMPEMNQSGSTLTLEEEWVKNSGQKATKSSWVIKVPSGIAFKTNIGAGDATYEALELQLRHNTGAGKLKLDGLSGKLKVNMGAGPVDVSNGNGEFQVNNGTGDITTSGGTGQFSMNSGTGDVAVSNCKITVASSFNSGTGDVSVSLDGELAADIKANSGTGDATLDFNGSDISGMIKMICHEKKGKIIAPFKFDTEEVKRNDGNGPMWHKTAQLGNSSYRIRISSHSGTAKVKE